MNETIAAIVAENLVTEGVATGRCWIATVRGLVAALTGATHAEIDAALWAGHQAGLWTLSRCDLVGAAPAGAVSRSELAGPAGSSFHLVRL